MNDEQDETVFWWKDGWLFYIVGSNDVMGREHIIIRFWKWRLDGLDIKRIAIALVKGLNNKKDSYEKNT